MSNNERHKLICEYTWGVIPVDTKWASGTGIYKEMEPKLLLEGIIKPLKSN